LSRQALQKGFTEQSMDKKFDGGPVMKEIKTFLEDLYIDIIF